jgi:predicted YcjX-like family ATPase
MSERRVGVIGLQGSGKTVLLTSLINHLRSHEPARFKVAGGKVQFDPLSFQEEKVEPEWEGKEFPYESYRAHFAQGVWPAKTLDSHQFICQFGTTDGVKSRLILYDMPGERLADIVMHKFSYDVWAGEMWKQVEQTYQRKTPGDTTLKLAFREFVAAVRRGDATRDELVSSYQVGLARLLQERGALITPSSFFLDFEGRPIEIERVFDLRGLKLRLLPPMDDAGGLPAAGKNELIVTALGGLLHVRAFDPGGTIVIDTDEEYLKQQGRPLEALKSRLDSSWPPRELTESAKAEIIAALASVLGEVRADIPAQEIIAEQGRYVGLSRVEQFVPIPAGKYPNLRAEFQASYDAYNRQVVRPLFKTFESCHSLLVMADVVSVLMLGKGTMNDFTQLMRVMLTGLNPGEGMGRIVLRWLTMPLPESLKPVWIRKIAFVIPKADLVPSEKHGKLVQLGENLFAQLIAGLKGTETRFIECSAVQCTSDFDEPPDGRLFAIFKKPEEDDDDVLPKRAVVPRLPDSWEKARDPKPFKFPRPYRFPRPFPTVSATKAKAPDHHKLHEVFEFLTA